LTRVAVLFVSVEGPVGSNQSVQAMSHYGFLIRSLTDLLASEIRQELYCPDETHSELHESLLPRPSRPESRVRLSPRQTPIAKR
jgi:hypothetical protein